MIGEIIKKLDEADASIREDLTAYKGMLGEKDALQEARDLIQKAITILLRHI